MHPHRFRHPAWIDCCGGMHDGEAMPMGRKSRSMLDRYVAAAADHCASASYERLAGEGKL
jgi:hypothetical protein